jgi:dTDP-4-dehydrorhamnose 3,5-epimerase
MYNRVTFIKGGVSVDDRGQVLFCNDFDMRGVRRFYLVSNHEPGFIRAWHAHKKETKFVLVAQGAAIVAAVKIDRWDAPDKNAPVQRYVLSEKKPGILAIPAGYANGFMTLVKGTQVIFFSDAGLKHSADDDYRYAYDYWNPWEVVPR